MTPPLEQKLINTYLGSPYYVVIVLLVTLSGFLYVFGLLPAYDPSILAAPKSVIFISYLSGFVGGLITIFGWVLAIFYDKITSLLVQMLGLFLQAISAAVVAIVILPEGASASYLGPLMVLIVTSHLVQIFLMYREFRLAPEKVRIMRASTEGTDE